MNSMSFPLVAPMIAMVVLAGCGAFDPHVFRPDEFDRSAPTFGVEPTDMTEVAICYNWLATGRKEVAAMAAEACGRFDRTAVRQDHRYGDCPLLTPVAARFACLVETSAGPSPAPHPHSVR